MSSSRPILWRPSQERIERSNITRYMRWLAESRGVQLSSYDSLWRWSVQELEPFWESMWEYFDVRASQPYEQVLASRQMPGAQWFPGARLNYAENAFAGKRDSDTAIVFAGERQPPKEWTWATLREQTAQIAASLRALGVQPSDRVGAYMPNIPETVAAFLATASIGAVWSSCSPDFGARGVLDRFAQIEPKVLLAVDGYVYQGKEHDRRSTVQEIAAGIPGLRHTVVLANLHREAASAGTMPWEEFLRLGRSHPSSPAANPSQAGPPGAGPSQTKSPASGSPLQFEQVPFDHPLWVLYSSGTTGLPKAIVQGQGGILLEHSKAITFHIDARPGERFFWFTTTGWMMWNFVVGGLLSQATIVLYDGSPGYPDMGALWDLAEKTGITNFGTSAAYLSACMKEGLQPAQGRDLSRLQSIGSTGSTLPPEAFDWTYDQLGPDLWLYSTSGGTDLCTAFLGGCPLLPVRRGELQCRALAAAVKSFDDDGRPLVGEVGELVVTEPMPSMPLRFWNDPDGERYRESYFSVYPGIWRHGDWLEITPDGGGILYGRSDATINRGGVRMGSSEIYRSVLAIPEVLDALVVDVDGWMPLFVTLREGATLDQRLIDTIKQSIREECSPRHVPNDVYAVPTIPRTKSGKILEVPVKRILSGVPAERAASREAIVDPDSLAPFIELARQRAAPAGEA